MIITVQDREPEDWTLQVVDEVPPQEDSYNCGPFVLTNTREIVIGDLGFVFNRDMSLMRRVICFELMSGNLLE